MSKSYSLGAAFIAVSNSLILGLIQLPGAAEASENAFEIYWNIPTFMCHQYGMFFDDVSGYGIRQNRKDQFRGDEIAILYDPGVFPALLKHTHSGYIVKRNGGVPQEGNLTYHLEVFRAHVEEHMKDVDFAGLAVIDFERWRPIFRQNWASLSSYRNLSTEIERARHPLWDKSRVNHEATRRFEIAARLFMEDTLRLARILRPKASWAYYAFPYCYNLTPYAPTGECDPKVFEENDRLSWMFDSQDVLLPSVYLRKGLNKTERMDLISGRVKEATRVSDGQASKKPVLPYFWYKYQDKCDVLLESNDLYNAFQIIKSLGADGIVMWGSSNDFNTKFKCQEFKNYLATIFGPIAWKFHARKSQNLNKIGEDVNAKTSITPVTTNPILKDEQISKPPITIALQFKGRSSPSMEEIEEAEDASTSIVRVTTSMIVIDQQTSQSTNTIAWKSEVGSSTIVEETERDEDTTSSTALMTTNVIVTDEGTRQPTNASSSTITDETGEDEDVITLSVAVTTNLIVTDKEISQPTNTIAWKSEVESSTTVEETERDEDTTSLSVPLTTSVIVTDGETSQPTNAMSSTITDETEEDKDTSTSSVPVTTIRIVTDEKTSQTTNIIVQKSEVGNSTIMKKTEEDESASTPIAPATMSTIVKDDESMTSITTSAWILKLRSSAIMEENENSEDPSTSMTLVTTSSMVKDEASTKPTTTDTRQQKVGTHPIAVETGEKDVGMASSSLRQTNRSMFVKDTETAQVANTIAWKSKMRSSPTVVKNVEDENAGASSEPITINVIMRDKKTTNPTTAIAWQFKERSSLSLEEAGVDKGASTLTTPIISTGIVDDVEITKPTGAWKFEPRTFPDAEETEEHEDAGSPVSLPTTNIIGKGDENEKSTDTKDNLLTKRIWRLPNIFTVTRI